VWPLTAIFSFLSTSFLFRFHVGKEEKRKKGKEVEGRKEKKRGRGPSQGLSSFSSSKSSFWRKRKGKVGRGGKGDWSHKLDPFFLSLRLAADKEREKR